MVDVSIGSGATKLQCLTLPKKKQRRGTRTYRLHLDEAEPLGMRHVAVPGLLRHVGPISYDPERERA
jgi:hypothetical protein